jgi:hypothetical protein
MQSWSLNLRLPALKSRCVNRRCGGALLAFEQDARKRSSWESSSNVSERTPIVSAWAFEFPHGCDSSMMSHRHFAAGFRAFAARLGASLAVIHLVLGAFFAARVADLGAELAHPFGEFRGAPFLSLPVSRCRRNSGRVRYSGPSSSRLFPANRRSRNVRSRRGNRDTPRCSLRISCGTFSYSPLVVWCGTPRL